MDTHPRPESYPSSTVADSESVGKGKGFVQHYENAPHPPSSDWNAPKPRSRAPFSWGRLRQQLREPFAEFIGTGILIIFGNGVNCQVKLTPDGTAGDWNTINIGWAVGTAMGVWVSAGVSGGHINPAVTLALATSRGFPWRKVPIFIFAQVLGAFTGAAIVYGNYINALNTIEGGVSTRSELTRGLFATYAQPYMTNISCFFSEVLGTFALMVVVLAIGDKKNCPAPAGLAPLALYFLILGIGASLGIQTAYAINPARDFGPRLLTAAAGYGSSIWTYRNQYWIWCPILGPICGAQLAGLVYDTFIYTGDDSPVSRGLVDPHTPIDSKVEARPEEKV